MTLALPLAEHEHSPFADLGFWGWAAAVAAAVVTVWVIWQAVRWTLKPGEEDPGHPKRMIFDDDFDDTLGDDEGRGTPPTAPTP